MIQREELIEDNDIALTFFNKHIYKALASIILFTLCSLQIDADSDNVCTLQRLSGTYNKSGLREKQASVNRSPVFYIQRYSVSSIYCTRQNKY